MGVPRLEPHTDDGSQEHGAQLPSGVGYECGYADQPHFTRNFREMFGITPSDFKDRLKEAFRRFREKKPDVVFLQDTQAKPD